MNLCVLRAWSRDPLQMPRGSLASEWLLTGPFDQCERLAKMACFNRYLSIENDQGLILAAYKGTGRYWTLETPLPPPLLPPPIVAGPPPLPLDMPAPSIVAIRLEVRDELNRAQKLFSPFNTAHEGYAVMLEEVDELWAHVKMNQKKRDLVAMRKEAIQIAAMAMRFALDVCTEERGRK